MRYRVTFYRTLFNDDESLLVIAPDPDDAVALARREREREWIENTEVEEWQKGLPRFHIQTIIKE